MTEKVSKELCEMCQKVLETKLKAINATIKMYWTCTVLLIGSNTTLIIALMTLVVGKKAI